MAAATFALAAALCADVSSGFFLAPGGGIARAHVPALSRHGGSLLSLRCSTLGAGADPGSPLTKGHRSTMAKQPLQTAPAQPVTQAQRAVDKLVESTRQIGRFNRGLEASDDIDEQFVGEWASWLNDNCPSDLTTTFAALTDERASHRKSAVTRLLKSVAAPDGKLAVSAGSWAFHALAARLGDDSAAVREAAVKGLGSIAEKGNRNVVLAMATLIEEEKTITVRTAALQVMARVAQRGDQEALAPVLNLLRRVEGAERGDFFTPKMTSEINRRAVRAVSSLADPGNEGAIKALLLRVMDDSTPAGMAYSSFRPFLPQHEIAAAKAVVCLAPSLVVRQPLQQWLKVILCARETVRRESQRARGHLTSRTDGVAVREEAVKGIASISCPFNPHVIRALSMSCEDEDESVRRAAMRNLRLLLKRQEAKQV